MLINDGYRGPRICFYYITLHFEAPIRFDYIFDYIEDNNKEC